MTFDAAMNVIKQYDPTFDLSSQTFFVPEGAELHCSEDTFAGSLRRTPVSRWVTDGDINPTGHDGTTGFTHVISGGRVTYALLHCTALHEGQLFNYVREVHLWPDVDPNVLSDALSAAYTLSVDTSAEAA
jgi:hypothetical protein